MREGIRRMERRGEDRESSSRMERNPDGAQADTLQ